MNAEVRAIRPEDLAQYMSPEQYKVAWPLARLSDPLFTCWYGKELLCVAGFIPETILSDKAYLWLDDMPAMKQHRVAAARLAQRMIKVALLRYPVIVGHCAAWSERWLRSLGATVNLPVFMFEAPHVE